MSVAPRRRAAWSQLARPHPKSTTDRSLRISPINGRIVSCDANSRPVAAKLASTTECSLPKCEDLTSLTEKRLRNSRDASLKGAVACRLDLPVERDARVRVRRTGRASIECFHLRSKCPLVGLGVVAGTPAH